MSKKGNELRARAKARELIRKLNSQSSNKASQTLKAVKLVPVTGLNLTFTPNPPGSLDTPCPYAKVPFGPQPISPVPRQTPGPLIYNPDLVPCDIAAVTITDGRSGRCFIFPPGKHKNKAINKIEVLAGYEGESENTNSDPDAWNDTKTDLKAIAKSTRETLIRVEIQMIGGCSKHAHLTVNPQQKTLCTPVDEKTVSKTFPVHRVRMPLENPVLTGQSGVNAASGLIGSWIDSLWNAGATNKGVIDIGVQSCGLRTTKAAPVTGVHVPIWLYPIEKFTLEIKIPAFFGKEKENFKGTGSSTNGGWDGMPVVGTLEYSSEKSNFLYNQSEEKSKSYSYGGSSSIFNKITKTENSTIGWNREKTETKQQIQKYGSFKYIGMPKKESKGAALADLGGSFSLTRNGEDISQKIDILKTFETMQRYAEALNDFKKFLDAGPSLQVQIGYAMKWEIALCELSIKGEWGNSDESQGPLIHRYWKIAADVTVVKCGIDVSYGLSYTATWSDLVCLYSLEAKVGIKCEGVISGSGQLVGSTQEQGKDGKEAITVEGKIDLEIYGSFSVKAAGYSTDVKPILKAGIKADAKMFTKADVPPRWKTSGSFTGLKIEVTAHKWSGGEYVKEIELAKEHDIWKDVQLPH